MIIKEKSVRSIWEELELGLGSGAKFCILLHMILNPKTSHTVYALAKATRLRTPAVQDHTKTLLELSWIKKDTQTAFSATTYRANQDNPVTRLVSDLIWSLKYQKSDI